MVTNFWVAIHRNILSSQSLRLRDCLKDRQGTFKGPYLAAIEPAKQRFSDPCRLPLGSQRASWTFSDGLWGNVRRAIPPPGSRSHERRVGAPSRGRRCPSRAHLRSGGLALLLDETSPSHSALRGCARPETSDGFPEAERSLHQ